MSLLTLDCICRGLGRAECAPLLTGDATINPDPKTHDAPAEPLRPAAVLIPIIARRDTLSLFLTRRAPNLKRHAGQVAFPGGRADPDDAHAVATALREAEEEVGLSADLVRVLGPLPDYVTGTGFAVTPIVSVVDPGFKPIPDPNEVAATFEIPLDHALDPANHSRRTGQWRGQERHYYAIEHERGTIWGASAAMLVNLSRLVWTAPQPAAHDASG